MCLWNVMVCFSESDHLCSILNRWRSGQCFQTTLWLQRFFSFSPVALDQSLNTESRKIREDLHTIRRPLASGFLSLFLSLSWVCLVLSDPKRCVDGRLNVHSHGKGQRCLTSYSHTAGLVNSRLFVPQQSTRWTVQDNCIRTITVSSVCLNVYSLFGTKW